MQSESRPELTEVPPPEADVSLILWMLSLSPAERLEVLQGFVDSAAEMGRAVRTKEEAGREKDRAVLELLRQALRASSGNR